jgi:hypothetical protein
MRTIEVERHGVLVRGVIELFTIATPSRSLLVTSK